MLGAPGSPMPRVHEGPRDAGHNICIDPHVAAGQRACLDTSRFLFLDCTLPLALLLALLLLHSSLHFSLCTPPFAFLRPAQYHLVCFQIGFLQVVFLLVIFRRKSLDVGCLWRPRQSPRGAGFRSFSRIVFRTSFFPDFYRFLMDFGSLAGSIFSHFSKKMHYFSEHRFRIDFS